MENEELVAGIRQHIVNGDSKDVIKQHVTSAGYAEEEFETAFEAALGEQAATSSMSKVVTSILSSETEESSLSSFMAQEAEETSGVEASATSGTLPSIGSFLGGAFQFGLRRYDLVLWSMLIQVVTIVVVGAGFGISFLTGLNVAAIVVAVIVGFVAMLILSALNMGALLYATSSQVETKYIDGFKWTWSKVIPLILLYLGFSLTVMGGFLLLVIPGLIVMTSTCLALFVFVHEDLRGIQALDRSRQLVSGHGWPIFGRLVLLWLVMFVVSIIGSIVSAIIPILGVVLQTAVGLFATVVALRAIASLYFALAGQKPEYVPGSTIGYRVLFWLGLLLIPIAILSSVVLASLLVARDKGQDAADIQRLMNIRATAEIFANQEDGTVSYAGVCDEVETITPSVTFECNDNAEAYAAEVELNDGYYCIDSTGYSEENIFPVIEGTSCGDSLPADLFGEEPEELMESGGGTFGDVIGELESARIKGQDAANRQRLMNMLAMIEISANQMDGTIDYTGACLEVDAIASDVTEFVCADNAKSYAMETTLSSGYFCVDSEGVREEATASMIVGTQCLVASEF